MKKMLPVLVLIVLIASCQKNQQEEDNFISTTITDLKGVLLKEVASGATIRLSAPELREINKNISLVKDGMILFDKLEAKIIAASDDYIITAVPILDFPDPGLITIQLSVSANTIATLCLQCLYYRPTVSGAIFAGFVGGAADGTFSQPAEMIHDFLGNLYVIDQRSSGHDVIIKVSPSGVSSLFAGGADEFGRLVGIGINNTTGLLYVSDATSQQVKSIAISTPYVVNVVAGSGTAGNADGTGPVASFRFGTEPVDDDALNEMGQGLTIDAAGNIYVGEMYMDELSPSIHRSQVRKITPGGVVTTVPGSRVIPTDEWTQAKPSGVAINSANELFTTCGSSPNFQGINKVNAAGIHSRFAGRPSSEALTDGTGARADFSYPKAISHFNGFLYIADGTNGALRRSSPGGKIITLAGVGRSATNSGSSGGFLPPIEGNYLMESSVVLPPSNYYILAARAIRMDYVGGVTAVHGGLIYVSDYGYRCIWKIQIR